MKHIWLIILLTLILFVPAQAHESAPTGWTPEEIVEEQGQTSSALAFAAEPGDSMTTLVRKAILSFEAANETISIERPVVIYMETNIVNDMGARRFIAIGETIATETSTIELYLEQSTSLTSAQFEAWAQYAALVDFAAPEI